MKSATENLGKFYTQIQKSLLAQRVAIQNLSQSRKLKGDYFEALIRSYIRSIVSPRFSVCHGGVFFDDKLQYEYDIMIFDGTEVHPLFMVDDVAIIKPEDLRCVIQIKGLLNAEAYDSAKKNLGSIKAVNYNCVCYLVAFESTITENVTNGTQINKLDLVQDMEKVDAVIDILAVLDGGNTGFVVHKNLFVPPGNLRLDFDDNFPSIGWVFEHIKQGALYIPTRTGITLNKT